jgi:superfamily II DNA or RNA helicase
MLKPGLYEKIINKQLRLELDTAINRVVDTAPVDEAEASHILAKYIAEIVEKGLDNIKDAGGDIFDQVNLTNQVVSIIERGTKDASLALLAIDQSHGRCVEQLLALLSKENSVYAANENAAIIRPETSISQSSLFTGAIHEPQMYTELKKEIISCDCIDMLVSFIKWSGLRLIIDELREFTKKGGKLRLVTTSYMGATDVKAIDALNKLQHTHIKVSYDTKRTRLHAKAYVFHRDTGFTTAYIGSSNLSNMAISSGLEWNVKVTMRDMPDTIKKVTATFESYWNSSEFEDYTEKDKDRFEQAIKNEKIFTGNSDHPYHFDIMPYPYQQEILDKLAADREIRNYHRNLIVAATGTGKTVISAFDYKRFCSMNGNRMMRLLFVAHREEILKQSVACFRGVLKDANFGDLFVGHYKPDHIDHLFISVQTLNASDFINQTSPDYYEYIIIDEFHHAAAPTYQKLLTYYQPKVLLGLTATPERMDGKSILCYFGDRIAAEIRLPEAIDRKLLCPFQYFGITDIVDLNELKWTRGGYDRTELSNVYTISGMTAQRRAGMIISSLLKYVTDLDDVKGLGFCVSVEHAKFMADFFLQQNIPAMCLTGTSPDNERNEAKQKLVSGEVRFIFVVDIYNEGVDIPEINTVLFLRPTESLTIFLQQLGRGLRLADNKECLTVLDFIGQANKKYNFESKFEALLFNTKRSVQREIKDGFVSMPKGCYIQLERKAKEYILNNIRSSYNSRAGMIARISTYENDTDMQLTLEKFTDYYHLDIRSIYKLDSFSRLCVVAGVREDFQENIEDVMQKAFTRICAIDSRRWISFLIEALKQPEKIDYAGLPEIQKQMLQMFQYTVWQKSSEECGFGSPICGLIQIKNSPVIYDEVLALLAYNYNKIDFIDEPVDLELSCPLDLYCNYTRDQIFVALDFLKPATVREGVKWLPNKNVDVLLVTLNKSDKDYSPTTMYDDYSINQWLFHWQSQSTTSEDSATGQRYIYHRKRRSKILLFVREFKYDGYGTAAPYTYLGTVNYLQHEGSRPMSITWKLDRPIPAKYIKKTNKLVVV